MGQQRRDEMAVLDVVAESVETDLGGCKGNLRRANEPGGRIDDPHDPERRGVVGAGGPHAERLQRGHGTGQQRGGAMIAGPLPPNQRRLDAGTCQRGRGGQAGRAAADDRHLDG